MKYLVKTITRTMVLVILVVLSQQVFAQMPTTQAMPDTSRMTYNQISQALGLFVYPSKKQTQQKQKQEEFECYTWAMQQSGIDPLNLPRVEVRQEAGPTGGAVVGAARGAAAGAAIGAIAGDAGRGAAIGAAAGGMSGRRQGQMAQSQRNQQAQANANAEEQALRDRFKKAFSVCMEGRGYTVK